MGIFFEASTVSREIFLGVVKMMVRLHHEC